VTLTNVLIGLSIAIVVYQAVGYFLSTRASSQQTPWGQPPLPSEENKTLQNFLRLGRRFTFQRWFLRNESYRQRLEDLLVRSGHPYGWNVEDLIFFKCLSIGVILLLLWSSENNNPLLWIGGVYVGYQFLDSYLGIQAGNRRQSIQRSMPGFIDLLTLTMEGGLDLLAAIERIIEKMKPSALREELMTLSQESRLGTPRKEALEHLSYRVNLPDMQALTSMVVQSEELGTSLSTILRSYAEDMRSRRITTAEEKAGKAPVKLLMPMMVFFFPIVFAVILGPLAMQVMSSWGN